MGVQGADLTGQRFGKLLVIEKVKFGYANYKWRCVCDCGNEHFVKTYHLLHGDVKSCGCEHFKACVTHGMTETRLYHIWCTMKARCYRKTAQKYQRYGGRGIVMCEEWKNDFQSFYDWSMANGYQDNLSIDRIDNDGNYYPSNCRWADARTQANNTSSNIYFEYNGERKTLSQLAREHNIKPSIVSGRIKRGWDVKRAIETPRITTFLGSTGR